MDRTSRALGRTVSPSQAPVEWTWYTRPTLVSLATVMLRCRAMPHARVKGVNLFYEESGARALPLVFVHEFAGDYAELAPAGAVLRAALPHHRLQRARLPALRRARRPRAPTRRSRPSTTSRACSITWASTRRTCAGCRWAATPRCTSASLSRARAVARRGRRRLRQRQRPSARRSSRTPTLVARRFEATAWRRSRSSTRRGPTRVQFLDKDPLGWQEFHDQFAARLRAGPRAHHARRADDAPVRLRAGGTRASSRCRR